MCVINVPSLQLSPKILWPAVPNSLAGSRLLALLFFEAKERKGGCRNYSAELLLPSCVSGSAAARSSPVGVPGHMMNVSSLQAGLHSPWAMGPAVCGNAPMSLPLFDSCHLNGVSSSVDVSMME